ncbi:hypothetical protein HZC21_04565 [Candidatus Peregrinibacteria bacterium]|nr:hypothetical protein [Candidatus Peregrinibacteria bacterium]
MPETIQPPDDQVEFDVLSNPNIPSYAGKGGRGFQMNSMFRLALEIAIKKDPQMTLGLLEARRSIFLEKYHSAGKSADRLSSQAEINAVNAAIDHVKHAMQTKPGIIKSMIATVRRLILGPEPSFIDQRTLLIEELRKRNKTKKPNP